MKIYRAVWMDESWEDSACYGTYKRVCAMPWCTSKKQAKKYFKDIRIIQEREKEKARAETKSSMLNAIGTFDGYSTYHYLCRKPYLEEEDVFDGYIENASAHIIFHN